MAFTKLRAEDPEPTRDDLQDQIMRNRVASEDIDVAIHNLGNALRAWGGLGLIAFTLAILAIGGTVWVFVWGRADPLQTQVIATSTICAAALALTGGVAALAQALATRELLAELMRVYVLNHKAIVEAVSAVEDGTQ